MFRAPGLTAVAVASANNYTAVFLGTANGRLLKVGVVGEAMEVMLSGVSLPLLLSTQQVSLGQVCFSHSGQSTDWPGMRRERQA